MTEPHAHAPLAACENCGSALQGHYCHVCGQRVHNPLNHFGHALEEVFESFWHLDGRIFRTLRDLFVPGRVAAGYLAGHRVRYVAPLRMFIILSVLTFFVGKASLHIDEDPLFSSESSPVQIDPRAGPTPEVQADARAAAGTSFPVFASPTASRPATSAAVAATPKPALTTIDAVIADRNRQLGEFRREALESDDGWLSTLLSDMVQAGIDEGARSQMRKLGASGGEIAIAMAHADLELEKAEAASMTATAAKGDADAGWITRWAKKRGERFARNSEAMRENPDEFIRLFLGAVPGALFVLVPLFALCLKLLYIRSGRGYLEHLVVALYSHAFMLVALLGSFLLIGLQSVPGLPAWGVAVSATAAAFALFLFVPLYLLWMQKRVYAQGWVKTLIKYGTLGLVYSVLLGFGLVYAVLAGLSS